MDSRPGRITWTSIAWSVLALFCLWLTVATVVDPDGAWWVPLTFGGCTVVAAGAAATWVRQDLRRTRKPPSETE